MSIKIFSLTFTTPDVEEAVQKLAQEVSSYVETISSVPKIDWLQSSAAESHGQMKITLTAIVSRSRRA